LLLAIDRIFLRVDSLTPAVRYYVETLKLKLIKQDSRLATFKLNDADAELVLHVDPDLPDNAVYYRVDSVRDLYLRRAELKLTFNSPPAQSARGWRATVRDPFGNVLLLLDRSEESGESTNVIEDAKPAGSLFAGIETRLPVKHDALVAAYSRIGRTADDLPYTSHFESLYQEYAAAFGDPKPTRGETWRHLLTLRKKKGGLPKMGDARSIPPEISAEQKVQLRSMLGRDIGKRDRLPYTPRFDELVDEFNGGLPRPLSPHLVWRLVATLAK
jgi:Glyoxalase/Bleomycin resistance protein/Dioxygenase superfamily